MPSGGRISWPHDLQGTVACAPRTGQLGGRAGTPGVIRVSPCRYAGDRERARFVRPREVRRVDGHHVRRHVWMDVAEDAAESRLVEQHAAHRADGIHPQVEAYPVAKREDVVKHAIVVGKVDRRPDADDEDVRAEAQVSLIEDDPCGVGARRERRIRRIEPDDRISNRRVARACNSVQLYGGLPESGEYERPGQRRREQGSEKSEDPGRSWTDRPPCLRNNAGESVSDRIGQDSILSWVRLFRKKTKE